MPRRRRRSDEEEDEDVMLKKRKGSIYFDDMAIEDSDEEEEDDDDEIFNDGFLVDSVEEDIPEEDKVSGRARRQPLVGRTDEDEVDVDAMEKMVNERYGSRSALGYDEEFDNDFNELEQQSVLPSVRDPKLWLVKCLPGREREVAASLMQKSLDKGSNSRILSAIALDHLKNYIYVEAYNEASVVQACKGMRYVFPRNLTMVPLKEMSNVLSVERKEVYISRGDWVRLKRSSYKGELAKVVDVDDVKQKVTVKVTPKFGALSLSDNLDSMGYLHKTVALSSVSTENICPSIQEVEKFREIGEADADMAILFKRKDKGCWMRGDVVLVVKGELKNLKGSIEYMEGDIVYIKPHENIPLLKTIALHKRDVAKYFEPGSQVRVVCGLQEGATGMVVKVDQNKLVILCDASKDHITVFAEQVIESKETSARPSKEGINYSIQMRHVSSGSRHFQQPIASRNMLPERRPSLPIERGTGYTRKRHDSFIGCKVKILHGPYRGYRGFVKGVHGQKVRVELEAQMKEITVERNHISDKVAVSNTSCSMPHHKAGGETPLHPRTPLHPMEATPVHRSSRSYAFEQWNPCSPASPSTCLPTP